MSGNLKFSLDNLIVEDALVGSPAVYQISLTISETEFFKPLNDLDEAKNKIISILKEKHGFKYRFKRPFKEGFLEFNDQKLNSIECFFAKETPTKICYEYDDLKIHEKRVRTISPGYSAKFRVLLDKSNARVVVFGGSDNLVIKAIYEMNQSIRDVWEGGHKTYTIRFSKEDMNKILERFGENVEYIYIKPGDSKKFTKLYKEKKGEVIKEVPRYEVHAKLYGIRITEAPIVLELIEVSGIHIQEIKGKLQASASEFLTTKISSSGKMVFYIPERLVTDDEDIFDYAEKLYEKVIQQRERIGERQRTLGDFFDV